VAAILLSFNGPGVARYKSRFLEGRSQLWVETHEGTGNAVSYRAGLTRNPAALDVNPDVKVPPWLGHAERLHNNHARRLASKILVERPIVDGETSPPWFQKDTRDGSFSSTGSDDDLLCHCFSYAFSVNAWGFCAS
jgi:hypothetical protein